MKEIPKNRLYEKKVTFQRSRTLHFNYLLHMTVLSFKFLLNVYCRYEEKTKNFHRHNNDKACLCVDHWRDSLCHFCTLGGNAQHVESEFCEGRDEARTELYGLAKLATIYPIVDRL